MVRHNTATISAQLRDTLDQLAPCAGDRLPAERDLSQRLDCSRQTLRNALAALERDGELWRHVGQGTFRGPRPRHLPLRETVLLEGVTPPDLMRARMLVEPQVAAEAARRADPPDVAYLRRKVADGHAAPDSAACEQADDAFHRALAQTAGNPVLIGLLDYLSGTRRRAAWQRGWYRTYRRLGADEFRTGHSDQHGDIVDAIAAADPDAAFAAMARHLAVIEAAMRGEG
ncbi:FadR/GntR family transcriptional regulator [Oceanibium sediminis]|uniref:FadR/GntR family transcriptional regulator n=1 Tax=Oceanibium sediminis TaxID=2026339 RepID=UPI000DD2E5CD|nr:FCD domain-containing protein [Oceanibium sediminis]